jgi:hypothetical protein
VQAFVDDLKVRKLGKMPMALLATAAIAAIAFGVMIGPSIMQGRRIDNMVSAISDSDDANMQSALLRLSEFDVAEQDTVTGNSRVKDRLIEYFITEIEASQNALDYPRAEALITEAQTLLAKRSIATRRICWRNSTIDLERVCRPDEFCQRIKKASSPCLRFIARSIRTTRP